MPSVTLYLHHETSKIFPESANYQDGELEPDGRERTIGEILALLTGADRPALTARLPLRRDGQISGSRSCRSRSRWACRRRG
jgi:hypothetical protein